MASHLQLMSPFLPQSNPTNTSARWSLWMERFNNYLRALSITNEGRKCASLLYQVGEDLYKIFKTLSNTEENDAYVAAVDALTKYFEPAKLRIAESMNQFFSSVGKDLASEIDDAPNRLLSGEYTVNSQEKRFKFREIQGQELRDAVGKLKYSKSFGDDKFSSFILKLALPYVAKSLLKICNTTLKTSKFPDSWKTARVAPTFKDGDKSIQSNYRPITMLPVVSRLFEKLVFNQLYNYLDSNGLLSYGQSGFRLLFSTLTCLFKTTDEWYDGFDNGYVIGLVFIDQRKAFDTINHELLCQKLEHYGVVDRNLSWFQYYLSNRKQFCRVSGIDSKTERTEVGAPQGSCLEPLLFLVYINNLPFAVRGLLKYAKRFLPQNSLKTLYTSIDEPHFRYCCAVLGCCGITEISKLQKLQDRAARIITNSSFDAPSKPLVQNLDWKTIYDMVKFTGKLCRSLSTIWLPPIYE